MGGVAHAQSTGSQVQEEETIVVTSTRPTLDGTISAETVAKTRATVTQEHIARETPGQTILETLNLAPGVNFTNNDPYGSSGGNLRLRSFDGPRVSLTFDGVPLNDSGNYAIFSNQMLDPELISRATVNLGTTDVDSPTASATGGTVNFITRRPDDDFGVMLEGGLGDFSYGRIFGSLDTGRFGPFGTTAFVAYSDTDYDKWKGPGSEWKRQINARLFQDLGGDNFASLAVHFNSNRNNFFRNPTLAQYNATPGFEEDQSCARPASVFGSVQNDNTQSTFVDWAGVTGIGSCTNYYNTRINPSDTGNIRGELSLSLASNVRLTVDPSFQYVLANGGGYSTVSERDDRLDQNSANNVNNGGTAYAITNTQCATGTFNNGVDLNGDGDTCDTVSLYSPNTTNTRRYGLTSSLIWDLNETNRFRLAYTLDYARHTQTGDFGYYDMFGNPENVFGGKAGYGRTVDGLDDSNLRGRDRFSEATLSQFALEYRGDFFNDALTINVGLRAPFFWRDLNQFCYSQNQSSNVRCTTETPSVVLANGNVQFASTGSTQFLPPYHASRHFSDVLPNVGVEWRLDSNNSLYASYAEGFSAPRTDNLYTVSRGATPTSINFSSAAPETTQSYDLGYRYQSGAMIGSIALWRTDYHNRIVNSFDQDLGFFVDRNIGDVKLEGVDAQLGFSPMHGLTLYGSASYIHSELLNNTPLGATSFLNTRGKELVETPDWTYAARAEWDINHWLSVGIEGRHVGRRFATDVNDELVPEYNVVNLDARLTLDFLPGHNTYLQLNVTNLLDESYLGSISSTTNALAITDTDPVTAGNQGRSGSAPTYGVGPPRTVLMTLRTEF